MPIIVEGRSHWPPCNCWCNMPPTLNEQVPFSMHLLMRMTCGGSAKHLCQNNCQALCAMQSWKRLEKSNFNECSRVVWVLVVAWNQTMSGCATLLLPDPVSTWLTLFIARVGWKPDLQNKPHWLHTHACGKQTAPLWSSMALWSPTWLLCIHSWNKSFWMSLTSVMGPAGDSSWHFLASPITLSIVKEACQTLPLFPKLQFCVHFPMMESSSFLEDLFLDSGRDMMFQQQNDDSQHF